MKGALIDACVADIAAQLRVAAFHFSDSRRVTAPGWPDWVLIGPRGLLFREVKGDGDKLSGEQRAVGYALQAHGLNWDTWRVDDHFSGRIRREIEAIANG